MSRNWIVASVLGLGLAASAGAQAQTAGGFLLPSVTGGTSGGGLISFTFDGFAVSIDQCALKTNGTTQSSCAGEEVTPTLVNGNSLLLTFTSSTGGALLSGTVGSSTVSDLAMTEVVTAPASKTMSSVVLSLAGTAAQTSEKLDVSAGQTETAPGSASATTNLSNSPIAQTMAIAPGPSNSITMSKDMHDGGTIGTTGDAIVLSNVTEQFNVVPEPASIGLLSVGLFGLIGARRKRRAQRPAV
jgi:hypothetical protein